MKKGMKQNIEFFDTLDQGWEETLANTYKDANTTIIEIFDSNGERVVYRKQHENDQELKGIVQIPEGTEIVKSFAFRNCKNITEIIFPSTAKKLESYICDNCTSLQSVTLCEGIEEIDGYAFYNCVNLKTVQFPSTLSLIGFNAFTFSGLEGDLLIPSNIKRINGSFANCTGLNGTLTLEEGLQRILYNSFKDCPFTGELHIPESVYAIEQSAFDGCKFDVIYVNEHMSKIWDKHWKHGCDAEIKYY